MTRNLAKLLDIKSLKILDNYAQFNPVPLSVEQFVEFGVRALETESYHFLKKELPVRFANIMKEMNLLPATLLQMPSVQTLQGAYVDSFRDLIEFEGHMEGDKTMQDYLMTLVDIENRCEDTVRVMAQGVLELKETHHVDKQTETSIQYFLDRFYMSRISLKMLLNQHILLFDGTHIQGTKLVGMIDRKCNVCNVVKEAFEEAAILCEKTYTVSPELHLKIHNSVDQAKRGPKYSAPIFITYPPRQIKFILVELFKNAMRATVETKGIIKVPPIEVLVAKGETDVSIKVSDQGGGIPHTVTARMFHYLYSTAPRPTMRPTEMAALAGYGYGLPMSKLYARYFHGDLIVNSYDGYGTDAIVYLKTNPGNAGEMLPIFNKTSTKQYKASVPTADWTDPHSDMNSALHYKLLGGPGSATGGWSSRSHQRDS